MLDKEHVKHRFIQEAIAYGAGMQYGDTKLANKAHGRLHRLYANVKEKGEVEIFSTMLNHSDENVRLMAAVFSLKTETEMALNTLRQLTSSERMVGISAKSAIDLWEKGLMELL